MSYQTIFPEKKQSDQNEVDVTRWQNSLADRNQSSLKELGGTQLGGTPSTPGKSIPSSGPRQRRGRSGDEQGFKEYFGNKVQKLREQFAEARQSAHEAAEATQLNSGIFLGVSVWVDGFTSPSSSEIKMLMLSHGGRFEHYFEQNVVTHIIADQLAETHVTRYRKMKKPLPVVRAQWIKDSCQRGELLDLCPYLLSRVATDSN
jgi:DNA repair protein REV1